MASVPHYLGVSCDSYSFFHIAAGTVIVNSALYYTSATTSLINQNIRRTAQYKKPWVWEGTTFSSRKSWQNTGLWCKCRKRAKWSSLWRSEWGREDPHRTPIQRHTDTGGYISSLYPSKTRRSSHTLHTSLRCGGDKIQLVMKYSNMYTQIVSS